MVLHKPFAKLESTVLLYIYILLAIRSDFYVSGQLRFMQNTNDEGEKQKLIAKLQAFHVKKRAQIANHVTNLLKLHRKGLAKVQGACKEVGAMRGREDKDDDGSDVEGGEEDDSEGVKGLIPVKQKSVRHGRTAGQRLGKYLSK